MLKVRISDSQRTDLLAIKRFSDQLTWIEGRLKRRGIEYIDYNVSRFKLNGKTISIPFAD
jgi:hypothetical protein